MNTALNLLYKIFDETGWNTLVCRFQKPKNKEIKSYLIKIVPILYAIKQ